MPTEPWYSLPAEGWEHVGSMASGRVSTLNFADGERLVLAAQYDKPATPVCEARRDNQTVCSLPPGHDGPHLGTAAHVVGQGYRATVRMDKPT